MVEASKKAAKWATGTGLSAAAVIWLYSTFMSKDIAEARFNSIETRSDRRDSELIRRMERIEDKQDKILDLVRRRK